ncbi:hypothetical protein BH10CYA1_BH10CYA1_53110 [soil metagenome]
MKIQMQKWPFPIAFSLALSLGLASFHPYFCQPTQASDITQKEEKKLSIKTKDKAPSDALCFDSNQLVQALTNDSHSLKISSREVTGNRFELQLQHVKIFGFYRHLDGKVVHVTVSGNGKEFDACMDKIVRLVNADNKSAADSIVARLNKDLHGKRIPDQCFQLTGTRYYLQKLSGIPTFHCTSTRADRRAILKAQPG